MSAKRRYFILGGVVFALLVAFCGLAYNDRNHLADTFTRFTHWITASPAPVVGSPAPDFELESLSVQR